MEEKSPSTEVLEIFLVGMEVATVAKGVEGMMPHVEVAKVFLGKMIRHRKMSFDFYREFYRLNWIEGRVILNFTSRAISIGCDIKEKGF